MRHNIYRRIAALATLLLAVPGTTLLAQTSVDVDVLGGQAGLACQALLCLSSSVGGSTSACSPALSHFYGIERRYLDDTLNARFNFLQQCPVTSQSDDMRGLAKALAHGSGRCDARSLNVVLTKMVGPLDERRPVTSNKMPSYCSAYHGHGYTDFGDSRPMYVGTPADGGYWTEAKDYDQELVKYEQGLAKRREAQERLRNRLGDY